MKTLKYKFSFLLLFLALSTFVYADNEPNNNCSQVETIEELNNISSTTSHIEIGNVHQTSDQYDYYQFTVASDGYIDLDFKAHKTHNSIFIGSSCDGTQYYNNATNDTTKYPPNFNVNSGDTIYITVERRYATQMSYSLDINFIPKTSLPPVVTPEAFNIYKTASIDELIDTVSATNSPDSFSIESGDTDNLFAIDENGDITVKGDLNNNSANSYDLNVSATNTYGTGSAIITINLVEDIDLSSDAINTRDFTNVPILGYDSVTIFGSILQIGNQILCKSTADFAECEDPGTTGSTQNNYHTQYLARIDNNVTHSNTMAKLVMQANDEVVFARLYWSARIELASNEEIRDAKKIKIKGPSSSTYTQLTSLNSKFNWHDSGTNLGDGVFDYVASADVTEYIKTNGAGEYYVGDIATTSGAENTYASWQLIVVVKNANRSLKNIAIYDGFYSIYSDDGYPDSITVSASGFITPNGSKLFDANLFIYGGETDDGFDDSSSILKGDGTTWVDLVDGQNDTDDVMNASVSSPDFTDGYRSEDAGMADPNFRNVLGTDIDKLKINDKNNASNQILSNSQTNTQIRLESSGDRYSLNMFAFETEVFTPEFCYDYSIKQDGSYLNVDRDAYPIARLDSTISSSDLEINVYLRNMEGDVTAEGIAIKSDVNGSKFIHDSNIFTSNINGTTLIDRGTPDPAPCVYDINGDNSVSNSGCSDGYNILKGNGTLDAGDYVYTKFLLSPINLSGLVGVDEPLGLSIKYYITAGGNKIEYPDYILGSENVPLCPPTTSYQPTWGLFNVVHSGSTTNNIYTQISRNPFDVDVIFDSTPSTGNHDAPVSDINTTVLVEIIDIDAFGDINASCANPDSRLSEPIFVPINFTPSNFQTAISSQSPNYYNFAVKNASFRIWYFADDNGTLIQNWTATAAVDSNNTSINSISGLYQEQTHTVCEDACSDTTSRDCYNCIRNNYAQPICSRDNFSIRPESYNLKIYDIDHSASAALKDLTKYNISTQDGFNPTSDPTSKRMKIAAGYDYRYDIDATGYDGIASVPGYTRYFNGASDYNATMIWDPQTSGLNCNDDSNVTLDFYVANGVMLNEEKSHSNVGQYKINIIDKIWTAVDWLNNDHHIYENNFQISSVSQYSDCRKGTSATSVLDGRYGCEIKTNHGFDNSGNFYQDHDIEFHPYKFDMTNIIPSFGLDYNETFDQNIFIYMADINRNSNEDQDMSFHLKGPIIALGEDNSTLSNFVDNCYAKDIDLTINRSNVKVSANANHRFVFHNSDVLANYRTGDMNNLTDTIELNTVDFNKSNNGTVNTIVHLNFDRNVSTPQNPETLTFIDYAAKCKNSANCQMNADLNRYFQAKGKRYLKQTTHGVDKNITINYLYARSYAQRNIFTNPYDQRALIYYEIFCSGANCDNSLLPDGTDSNTTDDPRWFINTKHTSNYGTAGSVNQKGTLNVVTQDTSTNGDHQDFVILDYDESRGYPYKTTMQLNSSMWLIYNKYNNAASENEFEVEYNSGDTSWGGRAETNATTIDSGASKTNRRFMW